MKNKFNFSKGLFHKNIAHIYCILAIVFYFVDVVLLISSKKMGTLPLSVLAILFVPPIITTVISIIKLFSKNEKMFKLYTIFSISYTIIAIILIESYRGFLSNENIRVFFESYSTLVLSTKNALPAISSVLALVVISSVISIIMSLIALFLVMRNVVSKKTSVEISTDVTAFSEEIERE